MHWGTFGSVLSKKYLADLLVIGAIITNINSLPKPVENISCTFMSIRICCVDWCNEVHDVTMRDNDMTAIFFFPCASIFLTIN